MLVAGVAGLIAFAVYGQVAQSRRLDAQVQALASENRALTAQITDRQREIAEAQTVAWLEEEARKLGYVFPGERVFVIVPPGQSVPAGGGVSVPIPTFLPLPTPSPSPGPSPTPSPGSTPSTFVLPASPSPTPG